MTGASGPPGGAVRPDAWGGVPFQQAWATNDLERAVALLEGVLGASDFTRVDDRVLRVDTPSGERVLRQRLAFGVAGDRMVEIVEPVGDDGGFWSETLPRDRFAVRLHHLSVRIKGGRSDWQAYRGRVGATVPIVAEGVTGRHHFLFADLRDLLGCYLEAVWRSPAGQA